MGCSGGRGTFADTLELTLLLYRGRVSVPARWGHQLRHLINGQAGEAGGRCRTHPTFPQSQRHGADEPPGESLEAPPRRILAPFLGVNGIAERRGDSDGPRPLELFVRLWTEELGLKQADEHRSVGDAVQALQMNGLIRTRDVLDAEALASTPESFLGDEELTGPCVGKALLLVLAAPVADYLAVAMAVVESVGELMGDREDL